MRPRAEHAAAVAAAGAGAETKRRSRRREMVMMIRKHVAVTPVVLPPCLLMLQIGGLSSQCDVLIIERERGKQVQKEGTCVRMDVDEVREGLCCRDERGQIDVWITKDHIMIVDGGSSIEKRERYTTSLAGMFDIGSKPRSIVFGGIFFSRQPGWVGDPPPKRFDRLPVFPLVLLSVQRSIQ